jgi:hypothetical protein
VGVLGCAFALRAQGFILFFVQKFLARPCGPAEFGSGAGYDLKTTVWVDQAYDFLMHFFGRNLCLND